MFMGRSEKESERGQPDEDWVLGEHGESSDTH